MADIRIKDLATTATTTASDDFMAVDGTTNGTRKLSAATPAFLTSVTTPSLTSPAATNLTLGTGTSGAAITVLSASNNVGIGSLAPTKKLEVKETENTPVSQTTFWNNNFGGAIIWNPSTTANTVAGLNFLMGAGNSVAAVGGIQESSTLGALGFFTSPGGSNIVPERMRISSGGTVSISSTTAGSSGAGALVVTGGISAGNTGSAASYFGGDVTLSKATPALNLVNTSASTFAQYLSQSTVNRALIFGQHGDSSAGTTLGIANAAGALIATATTGVNYPDKLVITTIGRPAPIYFGTNNTLALTLDGTTQAATFAGAVTATGRITSNTSGTDGQIELAYNGGSFNGFTLKETADQTGTAFIVFKKSTGSTIGSISRVTTTDVVAYNTTSDGRLKTNVRDFTAKDSGRMIDGLKPRWFDWKNSDDNGKNIIGFIAQEEASVDSALARIGAVTVGDDDPETVTKQWAVDSGKLVPILVAELQSLRARLAALEAK